MPDVWWTVGLPALLICGYVLLVGVLCIILGFSTERSALERVLLLLGILYFMPAAMVYMMVVKHGGRAETAPTAGNDLQTLRRGTPFRELSLREKLFRTATVGIGCILVLAAISIACVAAYEVKRQWHSYGW